MNDKNKALRLADALEKMPGYDWNKNYCEAADCLRRQHAKIADLEAELDTLRAEITALKSELADDEGVIRVWRRRTNRAEDSRDSLRELLKKCRRIMEAQDLFAHHNLYEEINTAIAEAERRDE